MEEWIRRTVGALGQTVVTIERVKERPWGVVLRARTADRSLYFKAVGPGGRHEPRILADLSHTWPLLVPDVLAVDEARGWILMADHGEPMRDVLDARQQIAVLASLLPRYAEMQRSTADRVGAWVDAGTPDRTVGRLPALLDALLAGRGRSGPLPISDDERRALAGSLVVLERVCDDLRSTAVVDALDHADLHGTNVLVDGGGDGRLVDWGDACISHPFSSLLATYELVVPLLPADERRAATLELRDTYLEPWVPTADDRAAFADAIWVGYVARAISNDHQSVGASVQDLEDMRSEMVSLLRTWQAKIPRLGDPDELLLPA